MTEESDREKVRMTAAMDQFGASALDVADMVTNYYNRVVRGLESSQAQQLTRDFHWLYWNRVMWPNDTPKTPPAWWERNP